MCPSPAICVYLVAVSRRCDSLLAKVVATTAGPAVAQVKSSAGCSVNGRESPWVTLLTGTWGARSALRRCLMSHSLARIPNLSVCPQLAQSTVASSPGSGSQTSIFPPQPGHMMTAGVGGPYSSVILANSLRGRTSGDLRLTLAARAR